MSFLDTLQQMIVILFAMVLGYAAQKKGVLNQAANGVLSKLLLNITAPALILGSAMSGSAETFLSKNQTASLEAKLVKVTKIVGVIFVLLTLVLNVFQAV